MIVVVSSIALVVLAALALLLRGRSSQDGDIKHDPLLPARVPQDVARWARAVKNEAENVGFPLHWKWGLAMLWQESGGDPEAVGERGEIGLMQVTSQALQDARAVAPSLPSNIKNLGPREQIRAGLAYASKLADYGAEGPEQIIRSYNEGPPPNTRPASQKHFERVRAKMDRLGGTE